jgi:mRNA interferase MazF
MTKYRRGDIVLVSFVFSDEAGAKRRPAVIISSESYNQKRQETIISAITSRTDRTLVGDYFINNWQESGLLLPSTATGIIRTIKQSMISTKLGTMSREDMKGIDKQLRIVLELNSK